MTTVYLALGSNLKRPQKQIRDAIFSIRQFPLTTLKRVAPLYMNKAVGQKISPQFYNTVAVIETRLPPYRLLSYCQAIEKRQKRLRTIGIARTIDVDIVMYGELILNDRKLTLPHPRFKDRHFVMIPLLSVIKDDLTPHHNKDFREFLPLFAPTVSHAL